MRTANLDGSNSEGVLSISSLRSSIQWSFFKLFLSLRFEAAEPQICNFEEVEVEAAMTVMDVAVDAEVVETDRAKAVEPAEDAADEETEPREAFVDDTEKSRREVDNPEVTLPSEGPSGCNESIGSFGFLSTAQVAPGARNADTLLHVKACVSTTPGTGTTRAEDIALALLIV